MGSWGQLVRSPDLGAVLGAETHRWLGGADVVVTETPKVSGMSNWEGSGDSCCRLGGGVEGCSPRVSVRDVSVPTGCTSHLLDPPASVIFSGF